MSTRRVAYRFLRFSSAIIAMAFSQSAGANLLVNGDFEVGNSGFSSGYLFSPGSIGTEGQYDVVNDPSHSHSSAASYGDHTTGTGLMLAANGATTAGAIVWSQTVAVVATQTYDFQMYVSNWSVSDPGQEALLRVLVDGSPIGTDFTVTTSQGVWELFSASFSAPDSSATISIVDLTTTAGGNDFAIDDLVLVPEPSTFALTVLGVAMLATARKDTRMRRRLASGCS